MAAPTVERSEALALHRTMVLIRVFESRVEELFKAGKLPGFVHAYLGEEAIAAGVCSRLGPDDYITSTHRGHGHALAKGMSPGALMAELDGRAEGACRGRGGSMHVADFLLGMSGANGIVGGGFRIAAGARSRTISVEDLAVRAAAYGMEGATVGGKDVGAVSAAAAADGVGEVLTLPCCIQSLGMGRDGGAVLLIQLRGDGDLLEDRRAIVACSPHLPNLRLARRRTLGGPASLAAGAEPLGPGNARRVSCW